MGGTFPLRRGHLDRQIGGSGARRRCRVEWTFRPSRCSTQTLYRDSIVMLILSILLALVVGGWVWRRATARKTPPRAPGFAPPSQPSPMKEEKVRFFDSSRVCDGPLAGGFTWGGTSRDTRPSPRPSPSGSGRRPGLRRRAARGGSTLSLTFPHRGGRNSDSTPILRIPVCWPALAGTFDLTSQHLHERRWMHNGGAGMNEIHARAGPCRASFCEKLPPLWGLFRALEVRIGEAPRAFPNRFGAGTLRRAAPPRFATRAFLRIMQT